MIEVFPETKAETGLDDAVLARKMEAVEHAIKAYTHNAFAAGYPPDVVEAANAMLTWSHEHAGKVGIKSETLSRHTVTYAEPNEANTPYGYPARLLGFLRPYVKARF